jgi:hypothetical protein
MYSFLIPWEKGKIKQVDSGRKAKNKKKKGREQTEGRVALKMKHLLDLDLNLLTFLRFRLCLATALRAVPAVQEEIAAEPEVQEEIAAEPEVQEESAAEPEVQEAEAAEPEVQEESAAEPEVQETERDVAFLNSVFDSEDSFLDRVLDSERSPSIAGSSDEQILGLVPEDNHLAVSVSPSERSSVKSESMSFATFIRRSIIGGTPFTVQPRPESDAASEGVSDAPSEDEKTEDAPSAVAPPPAPPAAQPKKPDPTQKGGVVKFKEEPKVQYFEPPQPDQSFSGFLSSSLK